MKGWERVSPELLKRLRPTQIVTDDPFLALLHMQGLPLPQTEYRFAPPRRWRFDYAWVDQLIALEQEGGVWTGGRHTRGVGFEKDCEKYAEANLRGWTVFRASVRQIKDGTAANWLRRAFSVMAVNDVSVHNDAQKAGADEC